MTYIKATAEKIELCNEDVITVSNCKNTGPGAGNGAGNGGNGGGIGHGNGGHGKTGMQSDF